MSISVSLEHLRSEIDAAAASPYLVSVGPDGRPHCVSISVGWRGDALVTSVGHRTFTNATVRPLVSLIWPRSRNEGHSLIVDATATATDDSDRQLVLTPTNAVLHRTVATSKRDLPRDEADGRPVLRS